MTIRKLKIGTFVLAILALSSLLVFLFTIYKTSAPLPSEHQIKSVGSKGDYVDKHGGAEIIMYSTTPGSTTTYHVYASKGFALILHRPGTTNVFEKWEFEPMTIEEFKERYIATIQDTPAKAVKLDESQLESRVYDNTKGSY